jgi:hypothetical protein
MSIRGSRQTAFVWFAIPKVVGSAVMITVAPSVSHGVNFVLTQYEQPGTALEFAGVVTVPHAGLLEKATDPGLEEKQNPTLLQLSTYESAYTL